MTSTRIRILKTTAFVVLILLAIVFLSGIILSHYAQQRAEALLKSTGAKIGSLDINLFTQSISIQDFDLNFSGDSTHSVPHIARIQKITVDDISIYDLVVKKQIHIHTATISNGNIRYNRNIKFKQAPSTSPSSLKKIKIDHLVLKNLKTEFVNDSVTDYSGTLTLNVESINSGDTSSITDVMKYTIKNVEIKISKLLINNKGGLYQTRISQLYVNTHEQKMSIDSILLIPNYPKYKFARIAKKQTDRINVFIPKVIATGFNYKLNQDSSLVASKIEIFSAEVRSFRDKRIPFRETQNKPLPMALLKKIPFGVEIDTIKIKDAKISYEEFPPEGFESGKLTFEKLNATLSNLSNRPYYNKLKYATLEATARIMGKGFIHASFLLPIEDKLAYRAKGKISTMALHHLNPVLENLAFVSIESGKLNEMNFNFEYTDRESYGSLTINYSDLKMKGLNKDKAASVNDFKSFLINTVVKNDKDKDVPMENRTGTIAFDRDRKRQVFNFWWKSILSGIKTSILSPNNKKN